MCNFKCKNVANCQSKFEAREVLSCVTNLKVHPRACVGNENDMKLPLIFFGLV